MNRWRWERLVSGIQWTESLNDGIGGKRFKSARDAVAAIRTNTSPFITYRLLLGKREMAVVHGGLYAEPQLVEFGDGDHMRWAR